MGATGGRTAAGAARGGLALLAAALGLLVCSGPALAASPGSLDQSFGSHGIASVAGAQVFAVAAEPDGSALVAGESGGHAVVQRLSATGAILASWSGPAGVARAIAYQPSNGDALVAGASGASMFLERLTPALKPDTSFGLGGQALAFAGQNAQANAVGITPGGGAVIAGFVGGNAPQAAAASFSSLGTMQWSNAYNFGSNSIVNGLAVQSNGAIVLVGSQRPTQIQNALIARLTSGGTLDSSFHGGALTYSYPGSGLTVFNAVAVQGSGQILAAGSAAEGPTTIVARYDSDGQLDPGFGSGGVASAPAGQNVVEQNYPIGAYGLAIGPGGVIVAAGSYENTGAEIDEALWAFTPSGGLDSAFGSGGAALGPDGQYEACGLALLPDGNLLTAADSTGLPDQAPCSVRSGTSGYAAEYLGFASKPPPPPPVPALHAYLRGVPRFYRKAVAHRRGIRFGVYCNQACAGPVTLIASPATARQLGLATFVRRCTGRGRRRRCRRIKVYRARVLGRARISLGGAGARFVTLASPAFKRALLRSRKIVRLNLSVTVTSTISHRQVTIRRILTFR